MKSESYRTRRLSKTFCIPSQHEKTIKPDTGITAMKWTRERQRTSSTGCPASHTQRAAQGKLQEAD